MVREKVQTLEALDTVTAAEPGGSGRAVNLTASQGGRRGGPPTRRPGDRRTAAEARNNLEKGQFTRAFGSGGTVHMAEGESVKN